jgi:hypothetical protein
LRDTPGTKRDYLGPVDAPLRLSIPAWLTGDDKEEDREGEFERKMLETVGKGAQMSPKDMQAMKSELKLGHSSLAGPSSNLEAKYAALPAGAMTSGSSSSVQTGPDMLRDALKRSLGACDTSEEPSLKAIKTESVRDGSPEKVGQAILASKTTPSKVDDIKSARNRCATALSKSLAAEVKKATAANVAVMSIVSEGDILENHDFYITAVDRCKTMTMFLGHEFQLNEHIIMWKEAPTAINWVETMKKEAQAQVAEQDGERTDGATVSGDVLSSEANVGAFHTQTLRKMLHKMDLLPVENVDGFLPASEIKLLQTRAQTSTSIVELDKFDETWEEQKNMLIQLTTSLNAAKKDLARENKAHHLREQKVIAEQHAKQHAETEVQQADEMQLAKKLVQARRDTTVLCLDCHATAPLPSSSRSSPWRPRGRTARSCIRPCLTLFLSGAAAAWTSSRIMKP